MSDARLTTSSPALCTSPYSATFISSFSISDLSANTINYPFLGAQNFANALELPNKYTGYAFLLDKDNKVRWRGCGQAEPHELETLYQCTEQLLAEAKGKK